MNITNVRWEPWVILYAQLLCIEYNYLHRKNANS